MKNLYTLLIIGCVFGTGTMHAQTAIPASGGNASGTGGTASYTLGQVAYTVNAGTTGTVLQGCQQPYEIYVVTGLNEESGLEEGFEVYPNPSSDFVNLKMDVEDPGNYSFQLFNNSGGLVMHRKIRDKETLLEMKELPPAAYYLHILKNQKDIKTFIIIKN